MNFFQVSPDIVLNDTNYLMITPETVLCLFFFLPVFFSIYMIVVKVIKE